RSTGFVKAVQRGLALVRTTDIDEEGLAVYRYVPANTVRLWKTPQAIALGRLKRGVTEVKSAAKAESSRLNGRAPVRPGHKVRGRPRKNTLPTTTHESSVLDTLRALIQERLST